MSGSVVTSIARRGQVFSGSVQVDASGQSWADGAWYQQLQPGSWRGVPFVLDAGETAAGRRVAIHEYPYRDQAWAEDLGKLPRRFMVQAFIVGDDCYDIRDAMLSACEQGGVGTLVHPSMGAMQCVLLEFQTADRRERGRVVEFQFVFIVAGDVLYPATTIATGQTISRLSIALRSASAGDLRLALATGGPVPAAAVGGVVGYSALATRAVGDPANVFNSVRGLQGFYGRYSIGSRTTLYPSTATVSGLLSAATTSRTTVARAAVRVVSTAGAL